MYKRPEGETTQWEDLQRKFGNLPPKEPVQKQEVFVPAQDKSKDRQLLDNDDDIDALESAEDDFADDPFLEAYRWTPEAVVGKLYITRVASKMRVRCNIKPGKKGSHLRMYCCVQARAVEAAQGGCAADKVWVCGQHIAG